MRLMRRLRRKPARGRGVCWDAFNDWIIPGRSLLLLVREWVFRYVNHVGTWDEANRISLSLLSSCGASPKSSITVGVSPAPKSIPAPKNTKSLRWARAGNGKHTLPPTTSPILTKCYRWPSVVWQFVWAWIVAPYILWQARHVNDTQGWRTQTIACCIAKYVLLHSIQDSTLTKTQSPCDPYVARRPVRPSHGTRQRILDSSSMVRHHPLTSNKT